MKTYTINRCRTAPSLEPTVGVPAKGWSHAESVRLDWFHPGSVDKMPVTYFRALYDQHYIYVRFDVMDNFVKVVKTHLHDNVCEDSCVEFFVRPAGDETYFNFEINAGGTMLLYHIIDWHRKNGEGPLSKIEEIDPKWCEQVERYHSMPKTVKKPIEEPVAWTITYRIPLALFTAYKGTGGVKAGDVWECNMFKCGGSGHDHFACWSKIGKELNFHQPKYFGKLVFA